MKKLIWIILSIFSLVSPGYSVPTPTFTPIIRHAWSNKNMRWYITNISSVGGTGTKSIDPIFRVWPQVNYQCFTQLISGGPATAVRAKAVRHDGYVSIFIIDKNGNPVDCSGTAQVVHIVVMRVD